MVKTATRTLDVFEAFATAKRPLTLSELARAIGAPVASCFGIVRTLERRGYLYGARPRRGLYPTRRLLEQARLIAAHDPLSARLDSALTALRDRTRETVLLGKRLGDRAVYLDVREGLQTVRYTARVGDLKPLHSSAVGKALLGTLAEGDCRRLLGRLKLARVTPVTITSRRALVADLAAGRARGWYVTRGENVPDVMAVAVPVTIDDDVLAIAVAGPAHRMAPRADRHGAALLEARRSLEKAR